MKIIATMLIMFSAFQAIAQSIDSAAMTFSNKASNQAVVEEKIETGRYIKKSKPLKKQKRQTASEEADKPVAPQIEPSPGAPQVAPLPGLNKDKVETKEIPQPEITQKKEESEPVGSKMRDMLLGGDLETLDRYKAVLDSEDIRKNIFDFTLGSTYFYNASASPYFYRNYNNAGPGALLGLDIWLTPFFGISTDYRFSLLSEIKDSATADSYVASTHQWFDIGVKFRRFFGLAASPMIFEFGIKYSDYKLIVPTSSTSRLRLDYRGAELDFDLSVPISKTYSWDMGVFIQPFSSHEETVSVNDLRSGTSNTSAVLGGHLGGEFKMSRNNRFFFGLNIFIYKSQFQGNTIVPDPTTNSSPANTPVTNVFYLFDLGLKLGK